MHGQNKDTIRPTTVKMLATCNASDPVITKITDTCYNDHSYDRDCNYYNLASAAKNHAETRELTNACTKLKSTHLTANSFPIHPTYLSRDLASEE